MKFIALAFLGVALATYSSPALPVPLKVNTEYRYQFQGSLESGLPINAETTNTRINTNVVFQVVDDRSVLFRLENIELAADQKHTHGQMLPLESMQTKTLDSEDNQVLEKPVRFYYKNGIVSELQFDSEETVSSANFKRGIISMIQININKIGSEMETRNRESEKDIDFFTAMEKTVEGECQVAYTIVSRQNEKTTVTKSLNFNKCSKRPEIRYGTSLVSECPECEKESRMFFPQTIYNFKIDKDLLKEVELVSTYLLTLKNQPAMKTTIRSMLTLKETAEIRRQMDAPKGTKQELIYNTEWEENVERVFRNGDEEDNMISAKYSGKLEHMERLFTRMAELEINSPESVHILARMVRAFRLSSIPELKKFHQTVYKNLESKQQLLSQQALAVAGTKNTVQHLIHHIRQGEITPAHAVILLKSIQETTYPSVPIVDMLVDFAKDKIVRSEPALRQSVWLSIGSIVRPLVSSTINNYLLQGNTQEIKQKYIRIIIKELNNAETTYETILFIKTLANAAIDTSVAELEKLINDKKQKAVIRMESMDALRLISEKMPRKVQRLLMPIYMSRSENPEIRMKALLMLFKSKPEQPMIAQIVFNMDSESNQQVAAFTFKFLQSISESSNPCYTKMSTIVTPLLRESRFKPEERVYSTFAGASYFNENLFSGVSAHVATLLGKESDLPKELIASMETVVNGNWIKDFAEIGFTQQNIEQLYSKIMSRLNKAEKKMTRGDRINRPINLIKELAHKMNIRARPTQREDPYAQIYLRFKQMDYAVFPLDDKIIDRIIDKFLENGRLDLEYLKELLNVNEIFDITHASFVHESVTKTPTSLGLPIAVSYKIPTIWSAKGKVVMEKTRLGYRMKIVANPSWATTQVWEMRVLNPIFEQGVKILRSARLHLPVSAEIELDVKNMEIHYKQNGLNTKESLLHTSTRPVTYIRFFKTSDLKNYEESEETTIRVPKLERQTSEWNAEWTLLSHKFLISSTVASQNYAEHVMYGDHEIEVIAEPIRGMSKELSVSLKIDETKQERIEVPKINMLLDKEIGIEIDEYESRTENARREEIQRYVREISGISRRAVLTAGSRQEKITFDIRGFVDNKMKFFRFLVNTRVPTEFSEWSLKSNVDIILPVGPESMNLKNMNELKHREIQVISESTWGAEKKSTLKINMQLEQSKEQRQWSKNVDGKLRGMEATELLMEATRLNQIRAVVEYDLTKNLQSSLDRFYSLFVSYNFWNAKFEQVEGKEGRAMLKMTVEPRYQKEATIFLQTPQQQLRIENMFVPYMVLPTMTRTPFSQLRSSVYEKAECEIRRNKVTTFDEVVYSAPLTSCWSVIAKDCSEEPKFVVLVKNVDKKGTEKKVKIISADDVYELELVKEEVVVRVNGKTVRGSNEEYSIETLSADVVMIELKEVVVRFDGETVKVELSNTQMNTQCGLCGHFNGEKDSELRTASNEETDDLERIHRSYIVKHEECEMDESRLSEKKNYKMFAEQDYESDYEVEQKPLRRNQKIWESSETQEDDKVSKKTDPKKETRVIEFAHRICFSLEPVPTCATNQVNFRASEKKVKFTCLPRHEPEARRLKAESLRAPLHIQHMPVSFVENILVPQACEVY